MSLNPRFLLSVIGCVVGLAASAPAASPSAANLDAAFALVERAVAEGEIPGAVALVSQKGKILREAAYGKSDLERGVDFQPDTICWIASMTKAVTATAVMKLVDDGKVKLDDPIEKYVPEFKGRVNFEGQHHPISIWQLLIYTSGLPNNPPTRKGGDRIGGALAAVWLTQQLPDIIEGIAAAQLLFAPGTRQEYSSAGYFALGRMIEVVSGESYPTFVQKRIFEPLGMRDSTYRPRAADAGRMAAVFQEQRGVRRLLYRFNPDVRIQNDAGDGGIFSTTRDMAKFEQMFLDNDGKVLSRASVAFMHQAHRPGFSSGTTNNTEVATALGFTVKDGLFMHGGSSGVMGWGDHKSGAVGMLFLQFPEDQRRGERLRTAFRQAVQKALGGTPAPGLPPAPAPSTPAAPAKKVSRFDVFEAQLKSTTTYANPFADVTVTATFTSPSGRSRTAHAFFDGDDTWRVRFAPDETGEWKYTTSCSDAANRGLHGTTGRFACVASANKGFIRVDPVRKYWFAHDDGTPFWGNGDTCYNLVNGISAEDRTRYLDARAAQRFNFVRFHISAHPSTSPFAGGTDLDRFDLAHFRQIDRVMAELKARDMRAEVIVLNRYHLPFKDAAWTDAREERYVRYIVARLAAFTGVFLWTVANEYEVYPNGKYGDATAEDNAWAERIGELLHRLDPQRHPTTVHPWEQSLMDRGKLMGDRFGRSAHLDVLTQQYYGDARLTDRRKNVWHGAGIQRGPSPNPERPYYIGSGEGVDRVLRLDRVHEKPVINTESSYEHYDGSNYGGWAATDLARRQAWRVFMAGGAAHAAGFEGTIWGLKPGSVPGRSAFFLEDRGLALQLKHRYEFITTRTRFQDLAPAQSLVEGDQPCLANPGEEYVVYAPAGGMVRLDLSASPRHDYAVEWLDPRTGVYRQGPNVAGGARQNFAAPDADDWVLHVKRVP